MIVKKFVFLFITFSILAFANNDQNGFLMEEIIKNQATCVREFDQNKIYLKEDHIYPTEKGIFLVLNNSDDYLLIPKLFSDEKGCYVKLPSVELNVTRNFQIKVLPTCPGCKLEYFLICKNEDCPLKKEREAREKEKREREEQKKKEREEKKNKPREKNS
ncbi:MAG: hypothetical protein L0207_01380 [Chlamydiae bacterium]|nr:hypothetical protein [Chlamydiota bacterium]